MTVGIRPATPAEDRGRRRGHRTLTLRTYVDIPRNAPFYAKYGFADVLSCTEFHRQLADAEERMGLQAWGRRVLMEAILG